jgi:hypothetical protein
MERKSDWKLDYRNIERLTPEKSRNGAQVDRGKSEAGRLRDLTCTDRREFFLSSTAWASHCTM